jgi:hypothetical protein
MLDSRRRALMALLAAIAGGQAALAGGRRVRIVPSCSLHPYGYTVRQPGDRVVGVSLPVLTLPLDPNAESAGANVANAGNRPRIFQLDHSELRKDHCALGDVVVTAFPDGKYILEMTVSQSPDTVPTVERAVFERFARNRFHVKVRFSAGVPHRQIDGVVAVARPSLAQVDITPFWVEKRESRRLRLTGDCKLLAKRLDMVDHVEIDLSYE